MNGLNTVIQNKETLEEIIRRLKDNKDYIFLTDVYDNSPIVIDDKLHKIILKYFEDKVMSVEFGDIKTNHGGNMLDNDMISKIEKALGFKLYPAAIRYINTDEQYLWYGRACGRTTAYILRLVLQKDMTIELKDLRRGTYADEIHGPSYPFWFYNEFLKIRSLLMSEGIEVIKIKDGERFL